MLHVRYLGLRLLEVSLRDAELVLQRLVLLLLREQLLLQLLQLRLSDLSALRRSIALCAKGVEFLTPRSTCYFSPYER